MPTTDTLSTSANILGVITAGISLVACAITVESRFRSHLPSNKIKALESLLEETDSLFKTAVESGFLTDFEFARRVENQIMGFRKATFILQHRVYNATTFRNECIEFLKGTSKEIGHLHRSLKELRAEVEAINSCHTGRHLFASNRATHNEISIPSPPTKPLPVFVRQPNPSLTTEVLSPQTKASSHSGGPALSCHQTNTYRNLCFILVPGSLIESDNHHCQRLVYLPVETWRKLIPDSHLTQCHPT